MTKSTQTLTQSGLLPVLLQRQRYKVIQLARRRAQSKRLRTAFLEYPHLVTARACVANAGRRPASHLNFPPIVMSHQIHTYSELRQQIHDDLPIQHPEWVEPNGECPTCDSYESRLIELLDTFPQTGPTGLSVIFIASSNRD
jgi:hypothetical protein